MSLMSSASSSKPSSFCVQKKRRNGSMLRGRGRAPERAPSSQGSPLPTRSASPRPPYPLPLPRHATGPSRAVGRCRASRRVGATGGSHGGAAGHSRPLLPTAASPPSLPPCCARALRTSPSPPSPTPAGVARSGCAAASPSRSPTCVLARAHAAAGGACFCESLRCGPPPLEPPPPKVAAQSLHLSGRHLSSLSLSSLSLSGLHLQASWPGLVGSLVGAAYAPCGGPALSSASRPQLALTLTATPTPTPALPEP